MNTKLAQTHKDLEVYQLAFAAAGKIFIQTKRFPRAERFSLTDQILRSSRSVCGNITEAWRRRRYRKEFVLRLNYAEAEAAETQTWLDFAHECGYLSQETYQELYQVYDHIIGKLVLMIKSSNKWVIRN